ncbi:MAG: SDR family oxidoreductase [Deltaproteobacteria bacterium]|nr:SDR family oxidoreductase [Deltaproteobacteria bacterium]
MLQTLKILITGGGSGIGAALAKHLSTLGHSVIICGRRRERLEQVASTNSGIRHHVCDVSNENSVATFADFVGKQFDALDVLINCAGLQGEIGRFDRTDSKKWKETFEINVYGTYLVTKHLLPLLLKSKIKKILNFAGGGAFGNFPNYSAYAISKAAVVRFTENSAEELAGLGVQINCVAPGFVATDIHRATLEAGEEVVGEGYYRFTREKMKKGSVPLDLVVKCILFLISPESNGLSGKTISASFDKWGADVFRASIKEIMNSDLYTLRRMNLVNLDPKDELRVRLTDL